MATKQNPGKYDCYGKAAVDEPLFTLRAKDPLAPKLVRLWADLAEDQPADKRDEARKCAADMEEWYRQHRQNLKP